MWCGVYTMSWLCSSGHPTARDAVTKSGQRSGRRLTYRLCHKGTLRGEKMNTLSKYKLWIGGAFFLVVIGLIVGATRPKHTSGAQPGASPDVEVVQGEQKDVPI